MSLSLETQHLGRKAQQQTSRTTTSTSRVQIKNAKRAEAKKAMSRNVFAICSECVDLIRILINAALRTDTKRLHKALDLSCHVPDRVQ